VKDLDGAKVWDITVSGKLNINADMEELSKSLWRRSRWSSAKHEDQRNGGRTGEALVDKATGKTLQYTAA